MPKTGDIEAENDFHAFLKEGVYKVEYYSNKETTTEQKQLLQKLSKLIKINPRTQKYFSQIERNKKPAYNSNIGISRQEYNNLIDIFSFKEPQKMNGALIIIRKGNHFNFKGDGKLSLLDSITLDINNRSASFKRYALSQVKDSIDLSNVDFPKGDTLETFEFYSGPSGILGLTGLNGVYKLLIGKLKPSRRIYLSFFARQPDIIEHPKPEYLKAVLY